VKSLYSETNDEERHNGDEETGTDPLHQFAH